MGNFENKIDSTSKSNELPINCYRHILIISALLITMKQCQPVANSDGLLIKIYY